MAPQALTIKHVMKTPVPVPMPKRVTALSATTKKSPKSLPADTSSSLTWSVMLPGDTEMEDAPAIRANAGKRKRKDSDSSPMIIDSKFDEDDLVHIRPIQPQPEPEPGPGLRPEKPKALLQGPWRPSFHPLAPMVRPRTAWIHGGFVAEPKVRAERSKSSPTDVQPVVENTHGVLPQPLVVKMFFSTHAPRSFVIKIHLPKYELRELGMNKLNALLELSELPVAKRRRCPRASILGSVVSQHSTATKDKKSELLLTPQSKKKPSQRESLQLDTKKAEASSAWNPYPNSFSAQAEAALFSPGVGKENDDLMIRPQTKTHVDGEHIHRTTTMLQGKRNGQRSVLTIRGASRNA